MVLASTCLVQYQCNGRIGTVSRECANAVTASSKDSAKDIAPVGPFWLFVSTFEPGRDAKTRLWLDFSSPSAFPTDSTLSSAIQVAVSGKLAA